MTETILNTIQQAYPDAVYYTPAMIADALNVQKQTVLYHCRQLFPNHEGHYKFWFNEHKSCVLGGEELEKLIRIIHQSGRSKK